MTEATPATLITYWKQGGEIIEAALAKAVAADPLDAPFPLVGNDARIYHQARADAFRHALEMMKYPDDATEENLQATIRTTPMPGAPSPAQPVPAAAPVQAILIVSSGASGTGRDLHRKSPQPQGGRRIHDLGPATDDPR